MPNFISNSVQVHIVANTPAGEELFLLLQRSDDNTIYPGLWQAVTGWIESGETALVAAMREVKEETGLIPKKLWTIPYIATFFETDKDLIHASPVFGALVDYKDNIEISSEHKSYKWLNFSDSLELLELPSHKEGTKIFIDYILTKEKYAK